MGIYFVYYPPLDQQTLPFPFSLSATVYTTVHEWLTLFPLESLPYTKSAPLLIRVPHWRTSFTKEPPSNMPFLDFRYIAFKFGKITNLWNLLNGFKFKWMSAPSKMINWAPPLENDFWENAPFSPKSALLPNERPPLLERRGLKKRPGCLLEEIWNTWHLLTNLAQLTFH